MNVANLELCKELYELSGWETGEWLNAPRTTPTGLVTAGRVPTYDLGYLLRKLPLRVRDEYQGWQYGVKLHQTGGSGWIVYYGKPGDTSEMYFNSADTPEDCVAKLAIELFQAGVLTKEPRK